MNKRNEPKISIVIPVYNVEKYLRECLDSVINQTLRDIEIIIVDDGSTDNSGKICDEYASFDNRIKVIHQKNKGLGEARNEGLKFVKAQYIGFVDSDDYIDLDFYEKLYNAAIKNESEITVARIKNFYKNKQFVDLFYNLTDTSICLKSIVWDSLYKKDFLTENNIKFPKDRIFEDVLFTYKVNCFVKKRFFYVDTVYYRRRDRKDSILNQFNKNYSENVVLKIIEDCKSFLDSLKNNECYKKAEKIFYAQKLIFLFEMIKNKKSLFKFVKNEIKQIDISNNCYISDNFKEMCVLLLKSNNYWQFVIFLNLHKRKQHLINNFNSFKNNLEKIKTKIIYIIYLILLKLGIKDTVKKFLIKIGFKFDE